MNLVLFDIDGTLVASGSKAHHAAFLYGMQFSFGIDLRTHNFAQYAGWTDRAILRSIARERGIPTKSIDDSLDICIAAMETEFDQAITRETITPLAGVDALLSALDGKAQQGVVTGNCVGIGHAKLQKAGLMKYLQLGAFGSEHENRAELVRMAMARGLSLGTYKSAIVIGDTPRDVAAGKEAGARTVAVATGRYSFKELCACKPDDCVPTLENTDYLLSLITGF